MRCPECHQNFEVLDSRIYDFTSTALGCPITGQFPKHIAKVYLENVEILRCDCGIAPNVPALPLLQLGIFGPNHQQGRADNMPIDPYADLIYMGTWDVDEGWHLSRHRGH